MRVGDSGEEAPGVVPLGAPDCYTGNLGHYAPVLARVRAVMDDQRVHDTILTNTAERLLGEALATLRLITPEGWERVYALTLQAESGWNLNDVAMVKDARLLSMRGGPRFKPSVSGRNVALDSEPGERVVS